MALRATDETVDFHSVICKRETDAALLCEIEGAEYWIPKSQISDDSDVNGEDDEGTLVITEWIAKQKGLL